METNYYGPLLLSRAFAPVLAKNGGDAIVNLLSVLSWVAVPSAGTSSASKAAAWSLTNCLRPALREQGTQVIGVHAGPVDTDLASELTLPKVTPIDVVRQVLSAVEDEVLADDMTRQVKARLSDREGIDLNFDPERAGMGRVLRNGTNGWTCMPDIPGRPQHDPMCADEAMMQILMDIIDGRTPTVKKVGLSYMLLGEARQGQGVTPLKAHKR